MEPNKILSYFLPKEFVANFDLTDIGECDNQLIISMDEKDVRPPEHSGKSLESKGFTSVLYLHDFPVRDRAVLLKVRRRKWRDKATGKIYTRD